MIKCETMQWSRSLQLPLRVYLVLSGSTTIYREKYLESAWAGDIPPLCFACEVHVITDYNFLVAIMGTDMIMLSQCIQCERLHEQCMVSTMSYKKIHAVLTKTCFQETFSELTSSFFSLVWWTGKKTKELEA